MSDDDRTASLMTPARLAQLQARPAAAASPAAWLDQLAADAGSGHVRRLLDLRRQLEAQLSAPEDAALRDAASALAGALGELDFALLQPRGWLARATGKGKEAAGTFAAQAESCVRVGEGLGNAARRLKGREQAPGAAGDRALLELEVEVRALEKIMEQGARWLQDMRGQLKAREAAGGDAGVLQKIQEDTRRCELLVERLKRLRAASSAAQGVIEQARTVATRRAAVAEKAQKLLDGGWKKMQAALGSVTEEASGGSAAAEAVEAARKLRDELATRVQQLVSDAGALQEHQRSLAGAVAALREPLDAAA